MLPSVQQRLQTGGNTVVQEPYEQLEQQWAAWCGWPYTVACATGTAALHLALEVLQLPVQTEVLIPDFTMVACARACTMAELIPKPIDCDNTLCMDPYLLKVGAYTSAVMPVHVYGRRCNMQAITSWATQRDLPVIEDLAEAHGVKPHPRSTAACWSFYRNKIVAGEEGGMIAFRNERHAALARQLRSMGFTASHNFMHVPRGCSARLSNAHARPILASFTQLQTNLAARRRVEQWYSEVIPKPWHQPPRDAVWVYDVRIPDCDVDAVVAQLNTQGIAARCAFKPITTQPEYAAACQHSHAYRAARQVLYLPVHPQLTQAEVTGIAQALVQATAITPYAGSPSP